MSTTPSPRFVIAGTAGHIDHGKTALVKAITGTDTDRLKEEKNRGISIELGFAEYRVGDELSIGFVDVPGHERFVRNMLAGVGGIDFVVMVVAADEGVMPQTREHLDIVDLLGVSHGLIALTKIDLVDDPEWLELVEQDVRSAVERSCLATAPIIRVSSVTGKGLDDLIEQLKQTARSVPLRPDSGRLRLPVDRVFSVRGFGTVVTGTVWSGRVAVGDTVEIHPGGYKARIRNIQVHGRDTSTARAGQRAACALTGVDRSRIDRGSTLAAIGLLSPSYIVDARLHVLPSSPWPVQHRMRVHFHHATSECLARIVPLEAETIGPGQSGLAQIRTETPVALLPGDRFVLRSYSPVVTIAGGVALDPWAPKHRRRRPEVLRGLEARERGDETRTIAEIVRAAGPGGLSRTDRRLTTILGPDGEDSAELERRIRASIEAGAVVELPGGRLLARTYVDRSVKELMERLDRHHRAAPLEMGLHRAEAASRLAKLQPGLPADSILEFAERQGLIRSVRDRVARTDFEVRYSDEERRVRDLLRELFGGEERFTPPTIEQAIDRLPQAARAVGERVVHAMLAEGELIRLSGQILIHRAALDEIRRGVERVLREEGSVSVPHLREAFGCSRKYAIPLLEYFDRDGLTVRDGDVRRPGPGFAGPERR